MGEMPVLKCLVEEQGDMNPSDLANKLGHSRARMSRIIESLEAKDFISRKQDTKDKRRYLISITDKGRQYYEKENQQSVSALAHMLSQMGESDVEDLLRILKKGYEITYDTDPMIDEK